MSNDNPMGDQPAESHHTDEEATGQPRRSGTGSWWLWALFGLVLVAYVALDRGGAAGTQHPSVGTRLAGLSLVPLTTAIPPAELTSEALQGKVVLLNFWGTWCGPCLQEFPHIVQVHRRFSAHREFELVSVSCPYGAEDLQALAEKTAKKLADSGAEFATYADLGGENLQHIAATAGLPGSGIPLTVVLDREGIIQGLWQGYRPGDELQVEQVLSRLL